MTKDDLEIEHVDYSYSAESSCTLSMNAARSDRYLDRLRSGIRVPKVIAHMLSLTEPGDDVLDIGANIGGVALPLALAERRVLAVEAQAENYALLVDAALVNETSSLPPVHVAAGATAGTTEIAGASAFARVEAGDGDRQHPGVVTIDAVAELFGFSQSRVMKLDIEGSELAALRGASTLLGGATLQHILMEGNGAHCYRMGHRPADLLALLEPYGFRAFLISGRRLVPFTSSDFQYGANVDYLVTRGDEPLAASMTIAPAGEQEVADGIEHALVGSSATYRSFMLAELRHAPAEMLDHPTVRAAIDSVIETVQRPQELLDALLER